MEFSCALRSNLSSTKLCSVRPNRKQLKSNFQVTLVKRRGRYSRVKSVLNNQEWGSINDNESTEPARILFERLFSQTQKLEQHLSRDNSYDVRLHFSFENLEIDLHAALVALKKREEDLQDAEKAVFLEHGELTRGKEELEQQEKEIAAACSRQEKLEAELKQANLKFLSQTKQIKDLKFRLEERDRAFTTARSALSLKEDELEKTRNELITKREEASRLHDQIKEKTRLVNVANEVVKNQEDEVSGISETILHKEEEVRYYVNLKKQGEDKVKVAEANLENMTREWLLTKEELKKLAEVAKHVGEGNEAFEDFRRVKNLLVDIRAELVSSQKSLALSRQQMEEQEQVLMEQIAKLEEQKNIVMDYVGDLIDANLEVKNEKEKLKVAEAQKNELELDSSIKSELIEKLQKTLEEERNSVQQTTMEISSLREELEQTKTEFNETRNLLQIKDSELIEAMVEIQHLKSEQASLNLTLEEKDRELCNAVKKLEELTVEVLDLKTLMSSKEDQLIQATAVMKEKDAQVQMIQTELTRTKVKASEAEEVVEQIVDLTNNLVISVENNDLNEFRQVSVQQWDNPAPDYKLQCEMLRSEIKNEEMKLVALQEALEQKDEELKMAKEEFNAREKLIAMFKEGDNTNDLTSLYDLVQERIGKNGLGDLVTELLMLESAHLDAETARTALQKLAEMSGQVLSKARSSMDLDPRVGECSPAAEEDYDGWTIFETEVTRLLTLSDRLVREARMG